MATIAQIPARVAFTISGNSPLKLTYPEAASQSFKAGQFVYLASGKVTACADDATAILGIAVADATGTTDADCEVILATRDVVFEANIYHGTPASAVTAVTQPTSTFGLQVDSNKCYVDIEETSTIAFIVIALSPRDTVGDQYGRVLFQVIDSVSQIAHDLDTTE